MDLTNTHILDLLEPAWCFSLENCGKYKSIYIVITIYKMIGSVQDLPNLMPSKLLTSKPVSSLPPEIGRAHV